MLSYYTLRMIPQFRKAKEVSKYKQMKSSIVNLLVKHV